MKIQVYRVVIKGASKRWRTREEEEEEQAAAAAIYC